MGSLAYELESLRNMHQPLEVVYGLIDATRWAHAVALTLLCYDTLLTLSDEVHSIWPMRMSLIKLCLYGNRLLAFMFIFFHAGPLAALNRSFSNKYCEIINIAGGYGALLSFAMANWILLARTRTLLGQKKLYNILLILYFLVAYGITLALVVYSTIPLISTTFYSRMSHICAILDRPRIIGLVWICPMIFETTIFILTTALLYKKTAQAVTLVGSRLISVLYRDGVCYYLIIVALRTWNLLTWTVFPFSYMFTGHFLLWAIMSISVTRLQLNLMNAAKHGHLSEGSRVYPIDTLGRNCRSEHLASSHRVISLSNMESRPNL